jgi:hypothetical protein
MNKAEVKHFTEPEEVREFPKGRVELTRIGDLIVGRAILQPGWRWSACVRPIAKTKSCEASHVQYQIAGVLRVRMDDGTEFDVKPGDMANIPPGHDAWVVGNEPVIALDFQGMANYAKQGEQKLKAA